MKLIPKIQIALDNLNLISALKITQLIHSEVDIIEVGTVLCNAEGLNAIKVIRALYPKKLILADIKIADAGGILSRMVLDAGADLTTVICCASLSTIELALEEAQKRGKNIQIELTGTWNMTQTEEWLKVGVKQLVYHRSRDAEAKGIKWSMRDFNKIEELSHMGFQVTVAGGITVDEIDLFKTLPIYGFIIGRGIRDAKNPNKEANRFREIIRKYWN